MPHATFSRAPLNKAIRRALFAAAVASLAPAAAQAQDANAAQTTTLDRIEVTGSNISRGDMETASPVQSITRQEIDRSGKATLAEYLQTLTSDGAGSVPRTYGTGFASGGSGVSLRGLGAGSTLVLLNGRRMAPYGLADDGQKVFTDLSVIPMDAVERVEILKDGASAIYGSDAIAGVVNIILRKEFKGVSVRSSYGVSGEGDGQMAKASATFGFGSLNDDRYNVYFNIEGGQTDEIRVADRRDRKWIGTGDARRWGYSQTKRFMNGFILGDDASPSPTGSVRNPVTGQFQSLPGCAQFSPITPQDPNGGCLWQSGQFNSLAPEEKYVNLFGRGTFALSDNFEAYVEAGYSRKKSTFHNTPNSASGAWGYPGGPVNADSGDGAVVLGPNHPDNPFPGQAVNLRYSAFDVGPRIIRSDSEFSRILAGVKGTAGGWDLDAAYLHSESELTNTRDGYLRYSAVRDALTNGTGPGGWWRIGQNANLNSQALYDYISPTIHADGKTTLDLFDIKGSRSLAELKGGSLGIAFGAEWRRQKAQLDPQTYTDTGDIIGLGYSAYRGTQEVAAAYAEMVAPVLESLELSAAVRYDSYKGGDSATTPKVGIKWKPLQQLALRATYAEGFRAPNPAESGKGGLAGFTAAADPVRCPGGNPAAGASVRDCDIQIAVITSPNPDLKAEESKSYTLGLVFEPTSNTTITLDGWEIKRSNEINVETTSAAVAAGRVVRSDNNLPGVPNSGTLLAAQAAYVNSASTTVRGIDLDVRQGIELGGYGKLNLDLQWSHISTYEREEEDGTTFEYAGTHGNCDVTNCIGTPKDKINLGATWEIGNFSLSGVANYIADFKNVTAEGNACASRYADGTPAPGNGCRIPSFTTFDLSGRWRAKDGVEVFGSVQNVTDKIAPLDPLTYGAINYNPMHSSGAIGRYFTVGVKYDFQ
ncbi:iron complex outermembrane recepter protein [Lysobacter sp. yr284]|uniref:TonB-dependent receptor n=1 Tax=Lysobacter sp. yr284 TaxID=1761791 RepID=UPI000894ECB8|nr:TonB-dependent receptor [Lysobacter sp. yr284]SDY85407.1 iron complex outermembrane recepter protein [Lysobacter sp. yr284]